MRKFFNKVIVWVVLAAFALTGFSQTNTAHALGEETICWTREDIGWGWASTRYRQIFNGGDLDHNGYQDMVLVDTDGKLWFYPAKSKVAFHPRQQVGWGWNNMRQFFGGLDFDGDRNADILGIDYSGQLFLYPGLGTGYFGAKRFLGSGWGSVVNISAHQRGFNGKPIIVGSISGTLKAWQTDGSGRFTNTITYGGGWDAMKLTAITGDVSGDGIADMWVVSKSGELRLYESLDASGQRFKRFVVARGWEQVRYLFPQADSARMIRAIFPNGILSQYTLRTEGQLEKLISDAIGQRVNEYRVNNGLHRLAFEKSFNAKAAHWSQVMAQTKNFKHSTFNDYGRSGENIAYRGEFDASTANAGAIADALFEQWRKSDGHNANMLEEIYQYAGVGISLKSRVTDWGLVYDIYATNMFFIEDTRLVNGAYYPKSFAFNEMVGKPYLPYGAYRVIGGEGAANTGKDSREVTDYSRIYGGKAGVDKSEGLPQGTELSIR